jgi:hypothetical protein
MYKIIYVKPGKMYMNVLRTDRMSILARSDHTRMVRPYGLVRAGPYGYLDHMGFFNASIIS